MSNPKIYIGETKSDGSCFYSSIYRFLLYHKKLNNIYIKNNFRFLNLSEDNQKDPYNFDKSKSIKTIKKKTIIINNNINYEIHQIDYTIKINENNEIEFMDKLRKFLIRYIDKDPYSRVETIFNYLKNLYQTNINTYKATISEYSIQLNTKLQSFKFDTLDNFKQILKDAFTIIICNVSQIDNKLIEEIFEKLFFFKIVLIQNSVSGINIDSNNKIVFDKDTIYLYYDGVGHYQFILTDI